MTGVPPHATPRRAPSRRKRIAFVAAAVGVAIIVIVLAIKPSGSKVNVVGKVQLAKGAPGWCARLIDKDVQRMAASLPDVALGNGGASKAGVEVLRGAKELRRSADNFPRSVAATVLRTSRALTAFVEVPDDRDRYVEALTSLQELADKAHQECGL